MNRMINLLGLVLTCLLSLALPGKTWADYFSTNSGFSVNPDFNSGNTFGWAVGTNAVPTNMSNDVAVQHNSNTNKVNMYFHLTITGIFVGPGATGQWLDHMETTGIHQVASVHLDSFPLPDGSMLVFQNSVNVTQFAEAHILRDADHTWLYGHMYMQGTSDGAVPIISSTTASIIDNGNAPQWKVTMTTHYLVTTPFEVTPTPGALALLGIAGLIGRRRHRS